MDNFSRIAISGKLCSGKTTVAELLVNEFGYTRMFFADELKTLCRDIANYNKAVKATDDLSILTPFVNIMLNDLRRITLNEEELTKAKEQLFLILGEFKDITYYDPKAEKKTNKVRRMLQQVGTEYMRVNVNDNIWVNALERNIKSAGNSKIIVDDLRYPNEFEMLRKNGFVFIRLQVDREIQIARSKKLYGAIDESKFEHISETALDKADFDYIVDSNGSIEELKNSIYQILGVTR